MIHSVYQVRKHKLQGRQVLTSLLADRLCGAETENPAGRIAPGDGWS